MRTLAVEIAADFSSTTLLGGAFSFASVMIAAYYRGKKS
jgi:hypothetical protein